MPNNSSPVSDTLLVVSVCSTLLLICTSFALVFATEDAENFKRCVQREQTSADECALIIYGR
jgi:biopolymer transport protein ExbB/TolQ